MKATMKKTGQDESSVQHVFIVGSKGIPGNYGGYETFVDKLTEYHQNNPSLKYHVACKAKDTKTFEYHNADCFDVKVARKEIPDLIITDVMMPVMDGFECCRILKEDLKTCHIPIILLTALVGDEDVVKGIELGADDYILKPFNPEILRTKVKRLIKSRVELKQIYTKLLMPSINAIGDIQEENDIAIKIEDPFVTQILKIINDNLQNQEFNVKKLAEMLNMSQPTLYRRVKQLTNFTIIELVRGVRLKRSAELLRTKKYSVQEVAEMVGYNDIPTFRKHFVDFYGTTPSTFNSKEETEDKK